jgi:hypothetical protein
VEKRAENYFAYLVRVFIAHTYNMPEDKMGV